MMLRLKTVDRILQEMHIPPEKTGNTNGYIELSITSFLLIVVSTGGKIV
jgi:hypothetical protein